MTYICPVCGYDKLDEPATRFEICPACGTEFGNDDYLYTHEELREKWIREGMKWWDEDIYRPANWSAVDQLNNISLTYKDRQLIDIHKKTTFAVGLFGANPSSVITPSDNTSRPIVVFTQIRGMVAV